MIFSCKWFSIMAKEGNNYMKPEQMKRIISMNITALIGIMTSSVALFYRIHEILMEHELLLQNHEEAIRDFTFSIHSITMQLTNRTIELMNYPLILCFITLLLNAVAGIYVLIRNRANDSNHK